MANGPVLGKRWKEYRPSKRVWFWSCAGCVVATLLMGFGWGGWVTGGTAAQMAADAAAGARAQLGSDEFALAASRRVATLPPSLLGRKKASRGMNGSI